MRKRYPSDISKEQFDLILPDLESARKKTKPRKIDLYDVFCAIYYVLKSGRQWRMLPRDFPKWESVYFYFKIWIAKPQSETDSVLEVVLKKIGGLNTYKKWQARNDEFLDS
jgi:transposase